MATRCDSRPIRYNHLRRVLGALEVSIFLQYWTVMYSYSLIDSTYWNIPSKQTSLSERYIPIDSCTGCFLTKIRERYRRSIHTLVKSRLGVGSDWIGERYQRETYSELVLAVPSIPKKRLEIYRLGWKSLLSLEVSDLLGLPRKRFPLNIGNV